MKTSLVESLEQALPGLASVVDNLTVTPGVKAARLRGAGWVVRRDRAGIPDFSLKLEGDTITLTAPRRPRK